MNITQLIQDSSKAITIVGALPLSGQLTEAAEEIYGALMRNEQLRITVLYESDSDLFYQSLSSDTRNSKNRMSFAKMRDLRNRIARLREFIRQLSKSDESKALKDRLQIKQVNLRLTLNAVRADEAIFICPISTEVPSTEMYRAIQRDDKWYPLLQDYIDFYVDDSRGGIYQSEPSEEMLVMYDREKIPRGIFPRKAFYNTDFQRYSVWLLVFNRRGELLLHQRSQTTKDNRGLWDKSAGGHVDIADTSTGATAERELIEELFLPEAEFTKYMRENPRDVINMGAWRPDKRGYERALSDIHDFGADDWAYFFIPDPVSRTSRRRYHLSDETNSEVVVKETKFISDVFLFVAPAGIIDDSADVSKLAKAAGSNHVLKSIPELLTWIEKEKAAGRENTVFTDDLLYIMDYMRDMLEEFSEMVRVTFSRPR